MNDWNPALYLQFQKERSQPCADLVARVDLPRIKTVLDLGCGPGNSARTALDRWPDIAVTGVDSSPAMIEQARRELPSHKWLVGDLREPEQGAYCTVLSNAAMQWVPDHASLLNTLFERVIPGGALAVQIPQYAAMPASRMVDAVFQELYRGWEGWSINDVMTCETAAFYFEALRPAAARLDVWETTYFHTMPHHRAIVDMLRSTGLRPYLDRVGPSEAPQFEACIAEALETVYPRQKDGSVLFPFQRLFFIAYRPQA